jgi:SAM-dependent methyltransferase
VRLDVPKNTNRLTYTRGVCEARDPAATSSSMGESVSEVHREACGLKPEGSPDAADEHVPPGRIDWDAMPASLDPARGEDGGGGIVAGGKDGAEARAERKRWQVESVYCALLSIVDGPAKMLRVVDFGSGSGNATLAVAWLLRERCHFVLLDMKPVAVQLAEQRVSLVSGLSETVSAVAGRIEDYSDDFDIGVAVHACGMATDFAQLQCVARRAPYLLVPCCVGKINIDVSLAAGSRYA